MGPAGINRTILHVEDSSDMASLVQEAFKSFGFEGRWLTRQTVAGGLAALRELERDNAPLHLILLDMQLPDGLGLGVLRAVKANPRWQLTPVIVLSGESEPELVNAAYALGAGCFLSKLPITITMIDALEALYRCWLEGAVLPVASPTDPLRSALQRAVRIRAQCAEFYLTAARRVIGTPDNTFWLERSLSEGNMSNLFAFMEPLASGNDMPPELIKQVTVAQDRVQDTLQQVEHAFRTIDTYDPQELCRAALRIAGAVDEQLAVRFLQHLVPLSPEAAGTLRHHAAQQLRALARYTLDRTSDPQLCEQAVELVHWADRLVPAATPCAA